MRSLLIPIFCLLTFATANAQDPVKKPPVSDSKLDTLDGPKYINKGKIAGRKAFHRSLMFPGLGQIYNYQLEVADIKSGEQSGKRVGQKIYILGKLAAIYAGGTILVISYGDNRAEYKRFLAELQYRADPTLPNPNTGLAGYTNVDQLTIAKNIYKRNSQVVLISLVGLYGVAALDAYVAARLKYFNVDESLAFKISPSIINSSTMYGFVPAPALKLTLKL